MQVEIFCLNIPGGRRPVCWLSKLWIILFVYLFSGSLFFFFINQTNQIAVPVWSTPESFAIHASHIKDLYYSLRGLLIVLRLPQQLNTFVLLMFASVQLGLDTGWSNVWYNRAAVERGSHIHSSVLPPEATNIFLKSGVHVSQCESEWGGDYKYVTHRCPHTMHCDPGVPRKY